FRLDLRLKLSAIVFVEMHSVGWLVMAVVTKGNDKTVLITCLVVRTEKYVLMVALYPTSATAYVTLLFFTDYRFCHFCITSFLY
ncbi:MAG: hypothetical protein U0M60_13580, partial [Clostridia bacterium]|nr:hypothetical protein [Clostridia bacterium]